VSNVVSIALSQLVLWYDAARVQTWPALLSRIPEGTALASATDFGRRYETKRMTDTRHAAAEKITRNLPGLERRGQSIQLRGVGLLERDAGRYRVSPEGRALGTAYSDEPRGQQWLSLLAQLLLLREPRTRVLCRCLSATGAVLRFDRDSWFGGRLARARIEGGDETVAPFSADSVSGATGLREVLTRDAWWSLGAWQRHELLGEATGCRFVGSVQRDFSLHDVALALRGPFEVFLALGILSGSAGEYRLAPGEATRRLGPELAEEFGWATEHNGVCLLDLLARLVGDLRSDTGYVVASELRAALRGHGIADPDREIGRLVGEGRVLIDAEDYGQSRHGEGLFGEPRKQLVKLRIETGGRR
jgi:hypothetical protein